MAETVRRSYRDVLTGHPTVARALARHPGTVAADSADPLHEARLLMLLADALGGSAAVPGEDNALRVELTADALVTVEAGVVAACHAAVASMEAGIRALTRWRVRRDTARLAGDALLLADPSRAGELIDGIAAWWRADTGGATNGRDHAGLAAASLLGEGRLEDFVAGIAAALPTDTDAYLAPASTAVQRVLPKIAAVAAEDYRGGHDGVRAGLAYLLDPLSACHTAALLIGHAAERLADGDARAATVARRWCYARVRDDTLEGLSERHLAKSRLLVGGLPVSVPASAAPPG